MVRYPFGYTNMEFQLSTIPMTDFRRILSTRGEPETARFLKIDYARGAIKRKPLNIQRVHLARLTITS